MKCSECDPVLIGFEVAFAGQFMLSGSEKGTSWQGLAQLESGDELTVYATDPGVQEDFAAFCRHTGHVLLQSTVNEDDSFTLILRHK